MQLQLGIPSSLGSTPGSSVVSATQTPGFTGLQSFSEQACERQLFHVWTADFTVDAKSLHTLG